MEPQNHSDDADGLGPISPALPGSVRILIEAERSGQAPRRIECRRLVTLFGSAAGCKVRIKDRTVWPVEAALINHGEQVSLVRLRAGADDEPDEKIELKTVPESGLRFTVGRAAFTTRLLPPDLNASTTFCFELAPEAVFLKHNLTGELTCIRPLLALLGREAGCHIRIDDPGVSRRHAILFFASDQPWVVDLGSTGGTWLNERRVSAARLNFNDALRLGGVTYQIRFPKTHPDERLRAKMDAGRAVEAALGLKSGAESPALGDAVSVGGMAGGPTPGVNPSSSGTSSANAAAGDDVRDLVDIRAAESDRRWVIADRLDQAQKRKTSNPAV